MSCTKIGLLGAIGLPNMGDEAILKANLSHIEKNFGTQAEVYVFTKNASLTSSMYNNSTMKIHCISFLHDFILENLDKIMDVRLLLKNFDEQSEKNYNLKVLNKIFNELNYFQFLGGGYISSFWPDIIVECWLAAQLLHRYDIPYILTGQSFYLNSNQDKKNVSEIVEHAMFIDFRTSCDTPYISSKKIITTDDAIKLPYTDLKTTECYVNLLIHPWRECTPIIKKILKEEIIPFLQSYIVHHPNITLNFLAFSEEDFSLWDNDVIIQSHKVNFINCYELPVEYIKSLLSNAIFSISSRFHAAVFSLSTGTPIFSVCYDEYYYCKIKSIHQMFKDINYKKIDEVKSDDLVAFTQNIAFTKQQLRRRMPYIDELYDIKMKKIADFYHLEKNQETCPSISVIIPIYNMGAYLNKCLDSVLNQTLDNIEVICINDGSVDNSQEVLNEYSWKDSRVKVFSQKNQGVSKTRNHALNLASGKYVFFLDPDDWLPDERVFDDLFRAAENNGAQICGGGFEELRGDDLITEWKDSSAKYVFHKEGFIQYQDYQYDYGWVRFIYRRTLLIENDLKLPTLKFFEDPVFFVKVMHTAKEFYALPRMSYCYRSGHHSYDLSYEKVVDLLEGLTQNIKLAIDNQYYELLRLEIFRLTNDYAGQIAKYLGEYEDNQELVSKFNVLNQLLGRDTRLEYEVFQSMINWLNYQVFIHASGKQVLKNALKSRVRKYLKIFLPNRTVNYIRKMRNK